MLWGGGGLTQDVGSGTIGVKKCAKWDFVVRIIMESISVLT